MIRVSLLLFLAFNFIFYRGYCVEKDQNKESFRLFAGNSNPELAQEVANILGVAINEAEVGRFHDGEIKIKIHDNVKGKDIYILQSICTTKDASVNDKLHGTKKKYEKDGNVVISNYDKGKCID